MPAYNFKSQFAEAIRTGQKRQSIRKPRKRRPTVPGDRLNLYTGMRTKNCQLLRSSFCKSVTSIMIRDAGIEIGGVCLSWMDTEIMARDDGFESVVEFFAFFEAQYGLPVELELIRWY